MPRKLTDLTGQKFGTQTVLGLSAERNRQGKPLWIVECECGRIHAVVARDLKRSKSCGCLTGRIISESRKTHGMTDHPAYGVWHSMVQRCTEPTHQAWKNYGGRGITVCERWLHSFENFWADMGPTYERGLDLDRRDNEAGYSPENCRWVTRKVNNRNKRDSRYVETSLGKMTVAELSEKTGIGVTTLHYRLNHGVTGDSLLTTPDFANRFMTCSTAGRDTASSSPAMAAR